MHAQGIVPKLHMSVFKVFCYQKLHTHIQGILLPKLTYKLIQVFCCFIHIYLYIYAHLRANFMLCTHLHLFEKEFSCHLSTLWKAIPHHMFILRSILVPHSNMCTFIKRFTTYSTYTHFIWRVFVSCYLFYIYMYMVNNIFTQSRRKENIKVQLKPNAGLKGESSPTCSHFHALLYWNQELGFLGLKSHSGTYSSSYKLSEH